MGPQGFQPILRTSSQSIICWRIDNFLQSKSGGPMISSSSGVSIAGGWNTTYRTSRCFWRALRRFVWKLRRGPICDSHRYGATSKRDKPTQVCSVHDQGKEGDTLCHQGLSTQSLDSTSIFQLCEPCNRVKAKPFGWTSSSLDPVAWQDHKHPSHSSAVVKFHTKRRRTFWRAMASMCSICMGMKFS